MSKDNLTDSSTPNDQPTQNTASIEQNPLVAEYLDSQSLGRKNIKDRTAEIDNTSILNKKPLQDWTIAIDLPSNFYSKDPSQKLHAGAEHKMAMLKELAAQTADKPVTIMVYEVVPKEKQPSANETIDNTIKRFVIADGKVQELSEIKSQGYSKDLTRLLEEATKDHPSKKIALVVGPHGAGSMGLAGETGDISLPEFDSAVKNGLKGSSHNTLDLLDLDACKMGQVGALNKMETISGHIIASAEDVVSHDNLSFDFQNYNAWLSNLLKKSNITNEELAQNIIKAADEGKNDGIVNNEKYSGTPTLADFNMAEQFAMFRFSFNELGKSLYKAAEDPHNKETLYQVIKETPSYGEGTDQKRDLKIFLKTLDDAIDYGALKDPDGKLKNEVGLLRSQQELLTKAYHGESGTEPYSMYGGLSVFLPDKDFNIEPTPTAIELLSQFCRPVDTHVSPLQANVLAHGSTNFSIIHTMVNSVQNDAKEITNDPNLNQCIEQLVKADIRLKESESLSNEARIAALANLRESTLELKKTTLYELERKRMDEYIKSSEDNFYTDNEDVSHGGWKQFLEKMRTSQT